MNSINSIFHKLSYLQYPLMLAGLFFALKPYLNGFEYMVEHSEAMFEDFNKMLIFIGLGITFSTLQDTTKVQYKLAQKLWENPKRGKRFLLFMAFIAIFWLASGVFLYFFSSIPALESLSTGTIILGIGFISLLKTAAEFFENHRLDKKGKEGIDLRDKDLESVNKQTIGQKDL